MSLFEEQQAPGPPPPLAERMRPHTLDQLLGQEEITGAKRSLRAAIEAGRAGSLLLWGPPGVGKTSLARIIASLADCHFEPFSAVLSGVKDVREAIARADLHRQRSGRGTMLFIDEIHRFNKAQQDAFLPHVESGRVVLIGATTENPSFSVIGALLSRCRVVKLELLSDEAMGELIDRCLADKKQGLGENRVSLDQAARRLLIASAAGDARRALNVLEAAVESVSQGSVLQADEIAEAMQQRALAHDKSGDHHFDLLSAIHKSMRNSDVQATVYWLARFLEAGADPMQFVRRMLAVAAEDIGLGDPMALQIATSAMIAFQNLGMPEGRLPLTEAAIYLASAPKSRAVASAIDVASEEVRQGRQWPVPDHLRNAPTRLAKELGHGKGYLYAPDQPGHVADMPCLPAELAGRDFYQPGSWGFEEKMRERLDDIEARRSQQGDG